MDDSLLANFQSAFTVGGEVLDTWAPHPHYSLYKQKREGYGNQEARRMKLLEEQRSRRKNYADLARRVVEGDGWKEEEDGMEEGGFDEVDAAMQVRAVYLYLRQHGNCARGTCREE